MKHGNLQEAAAGPTFRLLAAFMLMLVAFSVHADLGDGTCFPLYAKSRGVPGNKSCRIDVAGGTPIGMGSWFCTSDASNRIDRYCKVPTPVAPEKSCPVADPVYPGTGAATTTEYDFASGGDVPMVFRRTYLSASFIRPDASIGAMWFHNWQRQLNLANARSSSPLITAYREDGDAITFSKVAGSWKTAAFSGLALVDTGTGWTITDMTTGTAESYSAQGVLQSERTHDGHITTLTYSDASTASSVAPTQGLLIAVTQHSEGYSAVFDPVLRFAYDTQGRLTQMTDPTGAVTRYGYDANSNLVSVTWPDGNI